MIWSSMTKSPNHENMEVTFSTLVMSISSSTLTALGQTPVDDSGKTEMNLDFAKLNIGLLTLLREKTKGNLDSEEEKFLNSAINSLQMKFLEVKKEQIKEK